MSDEESFVILGTSPTASLEIDGTTNELYSSGSSTSLQNDTPGSRFTSLKSSQIKELKNAQEISPQTPEMENQSAEELFPRAQSAAEIEQIKLSMIKTIELPGTRDSSARKPTSIINRNIQPEMADPIILKPKESLNQTSRSIEMAGTSDSSARKPTSIIYRNVQPEMADPIILKPKESLNQTSRSNNEADMKLWSRKPKIQTDIDFSLEEFVLRSPLEKQQQQDEEKELTELNKTKMCSSTQTNTSEESQISVASSKKTPSTSVNKKHDEEKELTELNKTKMCSSTQTNTSEESQISVGSSKKTPPTSVNSNLAASFILGEVDADVLKTSVYSQFPSISMETSPEEVLKLQNMVTEYHDLKNTIKNANNTMKQFYQKFVNLKQQLYDCRKEIEMLTKQNQDMEKSFREQIEAIEIARKKDRDETVQLISEKNALLENLRAQIVKLEEQQFASFEFVLQNQDKEENEHFKKFFITRREHNLEIKSLQRQLSELLAKNLDFSDLEKQYIDELNCFKVNLTAAEELIKENRATIAALTSQTTEQQQQIELLEKSLKQLSAENEEQRERITLLEHQTEVHRKDFAMEKESRELALKDKQQILQDLRNLQKRNQELLEEQTKLAQTYERRLTAAGLGSNVQQITANTPTANSYYNNPQRPIRVSNDLPDPSSSAGSPGLKHCCPICNKAFRSLNILQSHVNDCLDRN